MNPIGLLLVAAGVVLEALRTSVTWIDTTWLGAALIVLGAVAVIFTWINEHIGDSHS